MKKINEIDVYGERLSRGVYAILSSLIILGGGTALAVLVTFSVLFTRSINDQTGTQNYLQIAIYIFTFFLSLSSLAALINFLVNGVFGFYVIEGISIAKKIRIRGKTMNIGGVFSLKKTESILTDDRGNVLLIVTKDSDFDRARVYPVLLFNQSEQNVANLKERIVSARGEKIGTRHLENRLTFSYMRLIRELNSARN